jgi:N6-L-threonylcarbamoyladenine synthase
VRRKKLSPNGEELPIADIAASFQETVAAALVNRTIKCAVEQNLSTIVAVGGVAANSALRSRLIASAEENNIRAIFPPLSLCTDNAAMIACAGALHLERGETSSMNIATRSRLNIEDCQSLYM